MEQTHFLHKPEPDKKTITYQDLFTRPNASLATRDGLKELSLLSLITPGYY